MPLQPHARPRIRSSFWIATDGRLLSARRLIWVDCLRRRNFALAGGTRNLLATHARQFQRLLAFASEVVRGQFEATRLQRQGRPTQPQKAEWLHHLCERALPRFGVELSLRGQVPTRSLLVSNHLSYLDILAFSAALPCVFVSKAEVAAWPIIGRFAEYAGTIFVQRAKPGDGSRANSAIAERLRDGVRVVLFPEGTTTNGEQILRFHSTMLQPAIDAGEAITPCAIRYELDDGKAEDEVCWWGDVPVGSHVLNLLGKRVVKARIAFGEPLAAAGDRKALGLELRARVAALYEQVCHERL
jgi:lyso-ornithine lipid O-acyltransferase